MSTAILNTTAKFTIFVYSQQNAAGAIARNILPIKGGSHNRPPKPAILQPQQLNEVKILHQLNKCRKYEYPDRHQPVSDGNNHPDGTVQNHNHQHIPHIWPDKRIIHKNCNKHLNNNQQYKCRQIFFP